MTSTRTRDAPEGSAGCYGQMLEISSNELRRFSKQRPRFGNMTAFGAKIPDGQAQHQSIMQSRVRQVGAPARVDAVEYPPVQRVGLVGRNTGWCITKANE